VDVEHIIKIDKVIRKPYTVMKDIVIEVPVEIYVDKEVIIPIHQKREYKIEKIIEKEIEEIITIDTHNTQLRNDYRAVKDEVDH